MKARVSERDSGEKKDKGDEDTGERGEGSRQGFNEEPLKFAVIEQRPCPLQKGADISLKTWRHFFSLPSFHLSL